MSAYDAGAWSDFGVAVVGAAAALVGLLFVAVSINLKRIVSDPTLPARAGSALILFSLPLVLGIALLIPDQAADALGAELIAAALILGGILMRLVTGPGEHETWPGWLLSRGAPSGATPTLVLLAGASLVAEVGGGLYWLPAAVVVALFGGLTSAWVLLVEILR